jgi:hypothetical protein
MAGGITQELLKELFNLDPETGILYWKARSSPSSTVQIGSVAGSLSREGYWQITCNRKPYNRSRLVFLFCAGFLPEEVDHRNRIKTDDRPCNLRSATKSQNGGNSIGRKNKKSGLPKGVFLRSGNRRNPFYAQLQVDNKVINLGVFSTPEEAHAAYCTAAKKHFGEFARFA